MLRDTRDADWDGEVCDHILAGQQGRRSTTQVGTLLACAPLLLALLPVYEVISSCCAQTWPLEALRQYIAWVKQTFQPALGAEAEEVLLGYWRLVRNAADRQASRSTVRMLESLIRLAQVRVAATRIRMQQRPQAADRDSTASCAEV